MSKKTVEEKCVIRSKSSIVAMCDVLCNTKTRMITVDFHTKDGRDRTINGMLNVNRKVNHYDRGLFPVVENIIERNSAGQCKTVSTQHKTINMATVSRIAFNKKVYQFI